jgi:uncharacterized protein YuzE
MYIPDSKSKASIEIDDLIIDYNAKKEISAIELLNASKFFKDFSSKNFKLSKEKLNEISECKIEIIAKNNFFMIKFHFTLNSKEELFAPVMIPSINELSPAVIA